MTRFQPLRALSLVWGECTAALYIISGAKRSPRPSARRRRRKRRRGGRKEKGGVTVIKNRTSHKG